MSDLQQKRSEESESSSPIEVLQATAEMPLIVSVRTGLAGKDDAIVRRTPVEYAGKTVKSVIDYVTTADITSEESGLAESVKKELRSNEKIVMINGKKAELKDKVNKYAAIKGHKLPDESQKQYRELEIEVSSVQQGGLYSKLSC